ncbi:MAG: DUF4397 domain-containing protein [Chitinophagaceae bacterium]
MKIRYSVLALLAYSCLIITACDKDTEWNADRTFTAPFSYVRIINVAPSFRTIFNERDSVNVSFNGAKFNAGYITYNSVFPSADYSAVPSGNQLVRLNYGVLNPDSTTIYSFSKTLEGAQRYSLIITDSIKSNNDAVQMWLKDNFTQPAQGMFGIRLVHAVTNDTVGKAIDLYSVRQQKNLFTNIQKSTSTDFVYSPIPVSGDTLIVHRSGTNIELARIPRTTDVNLPITLGNQRVYTVIYKGNTTITATTNTRARSLLLYTNL